MQELERASAVFCTACVCAELISRFVGPGWGHRCIKAVAGLYILIVFADALPGAKAQLTALELPQTAAVSVGELTDTILSQTEAELARTLEEQCREETGALVRLNIVLAQSTSGVEAAGVSSCPQNELSAAQKQAVGSFLEEQLQLREGQLVWESPGGEDVP